MPTARDACPCRARRCRNETGFREKNDLEEPTVGGMTIQAAHQLLVGHGSASPGRTAAAYRTWHARTLTGGHTLRSMTIQRQSVCHIERTPRDIRKKATHFTRFRWHARNSLRQRHRGLKPSERRHANAMLVAFSGTTAIAAHLSVWTSEHPCGMGHARGAISPYEKMRASRYRRARAHRLLIDPNKSPMNGLQARSSSRPKRKGATWGALSAST